MTEDRLPLADLLAKAGDGDFLRSVAEAVVQLLMETDVEGVIGAGRTRAIWRAHDVSQRLSRPHAGYPARQPSAPHPETQAGQLLPALPRAAQDVREGPRRRHPGGLGRRRFHPARRRPGAAPWACPASAPGSAAFPPGASTTWCRPWACPASAKSTVSKLCKDIDDRVNAFLDRPLVGDWPYLWLDATYLKQREGGRIVSVAAIIAVAANTDGKREIVGLHIGPSEAETFWATFLKSLVRRGLRGVKLVISDAHEGLKAAIRAGHGRVLAKVSRSLDAERPFLRRQGSAEHGVGRSAPGVHPARSRQRQPDAPPHCRPAAREMAETRRLHR